MEIQTRNRLGHIDIPLKRVHLELTNVCDFNCTFCPKEEMSRRYGYMDKALAKRLISEIGSKGIAEKVTFHVMGEPLLHRDFFEILDHAMHEDVKVGLTTNGSRLGTAVGKRLLDYPLHQLDISLQTPDAKSFELRKAGGLSFDDYLNGVLGFFSEYKKRHPDTVFKFRFLNTRFRKKSMEERIGPVRVMSTTEELRETFSYWVERVYSILGAEGPMKDKALGRVNDLVSYKWYVLEVYPGVYFETYVLDDWGHAFGDEDIRDAWGGTCFGMDDHFAVLWNGDVTLCCIDFDGKTVIGSVADNSIEEVLSSDEAGRIVEGFRRFSFVHPYCKRCQGSKSFVSWLVKPILAVTGLRLLKPFFYKKKKLYD